ncbi:hypothetical protein Ct61P_11966 [Colletotrichum tofieldiae]|nr:hypothetical protein Ct61P_11966 [Colletotrichum tofieldiae]
MMVLREKYRHAHLLLDRCWGEVYVYAVGKEGILLPPPNKSLALLARVVAVESREVEFRRCQTEAVRVFRG